MRPWVALAVTLILIAAVVYYFILGPGSTPRLEVIDCENCKLRFEDDRPVIEVRHMEHFEVVFKTSKRAAGMRIDCYCDTLNGQPHPLRGRVCGGYCNSVGEDGTCRSTGWVADADPGTRMGFVCYLVDREGHRLEGSKIRLEFIVTQP